MSKCFLCEDKNYITTKSGAYIEILEGNRLDIDFSSHEPCINIEINFCPICGRTLTVEKEKGYEIVYR